MNRNSSRREFISAAGSVLLSGIAPGVLRSAEHRSASPGAIDGHPTAREVGLKVLTDGGNAIDAAVAAALAATVVAPYQCGIGGYGGHMTIAPAGGKPATSIDFNTTAPMAATPDVFPRKEDGSIAGAVNEHGWLASGVPGTLAGLQLAADRFGSRPLAELLQPAIHFAEHGFRVGKWFATRIRLSAPILSRDPSAARLYYPDGNPLTEGTLLKNAPTAELLRTLAKRGSVDSFYRGDIAQEIAAAFKANDGLVTARDLATYRAREVKPIQLPWRDHSIYAAPLGAGGTTMLESLCERRNSSEWSRDHGEHELGDHDSNRCHRCYGNGRYSN